MTYNALVLPVLNYAPVALDPYLTRDINSQDQNNYMEGPGGATMK